MRPRLAFLSIVIAALLALAARPPSASARRRPAARARAKPRAKAKPKARPMISSERPAAPRPSARGGVVNVAPRGETAAERELQDALEAALKERPLKSATNGVLVIDLASGRVLYSLGADRQLNPASNVKLVSTATALEALGPDFVYRTRLLGAAPDSEGVVAGDLYLQGEADPTLAPADLAELAAALHDAGARSVTGDVVVGTGDLRDTLGAARVRVRVTGGAPGSFPAVAVEPDSTYFVVDNKARTAPKGRKALNPAVTLGRVKPRKGQAAPERVTIHVGGRVRPGQRVELVRTVPRPALFAAHTMRAALLARGIEVKGGVRRADGPPEEAKELAVHASRPLATLAAWVNKPSNNFLADRVIWTVGARLYGGDPTNAKGLRAMEEWLGRLGVGKGSYRLDNGSGLSHTNHLSARQIADVLLAGWKHARTGADFLASLAVAGEDGTLRARFRGHPAAGFVRGKTGTLNGAWALSGFVSTGGEQQLVFAILTNGGGGAKGVRAGQTKMVDAMYAYLVGREGKAPPPAVAAVATAPDPDDEAPAVGDSAEDTPTEIPFLRPF